MQIRNFVNYLRKYKGDEAYFNTTAIYEIRKCLRSLKKFAEVKNLSLDEAWRSFVDFTFAKYNVRLSKLFSYLGEFYDYCARNGLFRIITFNGEERKKFDEFLRAYKNHLEDFYHESVELKQIEILKQAFVRTLKLDLDDYDEYIKAQFDELEWTGQVVSPGHLNSHSAVLRYKAWKKKHPVILKRDDDWCRKIAEE
jgi:hypothetical protein